jgi:hypothetical protein
MIWQISPLARHVIQRVSSPRFLIETASYVTWRAIFATPIDRHIMQLTLNPRFSNHMASFDVAGYSCHAHAHDPPRNPTHLERLFPM